MDILFSERYKKQITSDNLNSNQQNNNTDIMFCLQDDVKKVVPKRLAKPRYLEP